MSPTDVLSFHRNEVKRMKKLIINGKLRIKALDATFRDARFQMGHTVFHCYVAVSVMINWTRLFYALRPFLSIREIGCFRFSSTMGGAREARSEERGAKKRGAKKREAKRWRGRGSAMLHIQRYASRVWRQDLRNFIKNPIRECVSRPRFAEELGYVPTTLSIDFNLRTFYPRYSRHFPRRIRTRVHFGRQ